MVKYYYILSLPTGLLVAGTGSRLRSPKSATATCGRRCGRGRKSQTKSAESARCRGWEMIYDLRSYATVPSRTVEYIGLQKHASPIVTHHLGEQVGSWFSAGRDQSLRSHVALSGHGRLRTALRGALQRPRICGMPNEDYGCAWPVVGTADDAAQTDELLAAE